MIPVKVGDHLKEDKDLPPPIATTGPDASLCDNCFHMLTCGVAVAVRVIVGNNPTPINIGACAFHQPIEEDEEQPDDVDAS